MKRLIIIIAIITVVTLITLFGCSSDSKVSNSTPKNFEELTSMFNANHKSVVKPDIDFEKYISDYKPNDIRWIQVSEIPLYNGSRTFTNDEVKEDINYLFKCLKDGYGLYNYFGGDEVFNASRDKLIEKYSYENNISLDDFLYGTIDNLAFIKDSHFNIYGVKTNKNKFAYIFDEIEFQKVEGKYIKSDNNKIVLSVNKNEKLDEVFKLSISSDGRLVYYPVIISEDIIKSINIQYSDDATETLDYKKDSYLHQNNDELKLDIISDIPIIRITKMGFDQGTQGENAKKFLDYATNYKDEKIVVVDLRINYGGNGILPQKWMMNYTSQFVPTNFSSLKYLTIEQINKYNKPSNINYQPIDELINIYGFEQISDSYSKILWHKDEFISNDNLLIVLVNKETYSAGEMFVDIAHNLENTIIVGTNTAGGLIGDNYGFISLPNSKIPVNFGTGSSFFPENYFEEFVGFMPDLWVKGDAEEAVLNLIENLKKK